MGFVDDWASEGAMSTLTTMGATTAFLGRMRQLQALGQ